MNNLFQLEEIEKKLSDLREEYKNAPEDRRFMIEMRARPYLTQRLIMELEQKKVK